MAKNADWNDNPQPIKERLDKIYLVIAVGGIFAIFLMGVPLRTTIFIVVLFALYFLFWRTRENEIKPVKVVNNELICGNFSIPLKSIQKMKIDWPYVDARGELYQIELVVDGKRISNELIVFDIRSFLKFLEETDFDMKKLEIPLGVNFDQTIP